MRKFLHSIRKFLHNLLTGSRSNKYSLEMLQEYTDIGIVEPITENEERERFLVEDNHFVGATATFEDSQIIPTSSILPQGIDPNFASREAQLLKIAKGTCFIMTPDGSTTFVTGTAFFITPSLLLTAGHVVGDKKEIVYALFPGTRFFEGPLTNIVKGTSGLDRFKLQVKENFSRKKKGLDIALLKIDQFESGNQVPINTTLPLVEQQKVDVLGYPGRLSDEYLMTRYKGQVPDLLTTGFDEARKLLPRNTLVASHGIMISKGDLPEYYLSTVGGMSGSPVVVEGEVCGIHVGTNSYGRNHCIAFSNPRVKEILEETMKY